MAWSRVWPGRRRRWASSLSGRPTRWREISGFRSILWPRVERLLTYRPRRIPLGRIETATEARFFVVMAGCGPDGALVHSLSRAEKSRFGRRAYYVHAARLFLTRSWPPFEVTYRDARGVTRRERAIGLMAARVPDLGGAFSGLTASDRLTAPHLHVQILRPPARLSLPAWFGLTRLQLPNPWLTTIDVAQIDVAQIACSPLDSRRAAAVHGQADAEPIGTAPFHLRIVADALTLLMPQ